MKVYHVPYVTCKGEVMEGSLVARRREVCVLWWDGDITEGKEERKKRVGKRDAEFFSLLYSPPPSSLRRFGGRRALTSYVLKS